MKILYQRGNTLSRFGKDNKKAALSDGNKKYATFSRIEPGYAGANLREIPVTGCILCTPTKSPADISRNELGAPKGVWIITGQTVTKCIVCIQVK